MSSDFGAFCMTCMEYRHLGQQMGSKMYITFGYGSQDEKGRSEVGAWLRWHLRNDCQVEVGLPAHFDLTLFKRNEETLQQLLDRPDKPPPAPPEPPHVSHEQMKAKEFSRAFLDYLALKEASPKLQALAKAGSDYVRSMLRGPHPISQWLRGVLLGTISVPKEVQMAILVAHQMGYVSLFLEQLEKLEWWKQHE